MKNPRWLRLSAHTDSFNLVFCATIARVCTTLISFILFRSASPMRSHERDQCEPSFSLQRREARELKPPPPPLLHREVFTVYPKRINIELLILNQIQRRTFLALQQQACQVWITSDEPFWRFMNTKQTEIPCFILRYGLIFQYSFSVLLCQRNHNEMFFYQLASIFLKSTTTFLTRRNVSSWRTMADCWESHPRRILTLWPEQPTQSSKYYRSGAFGCHWVQP